MNVFSGSVISLPSSTEIFAIVPLPPFALNESLYSAGLLSSPVIQPVSSKSAATNVVNSLGVRGGGSKEVDFHCFLHLPFDF